MKQRKVKFKKFIPIAWAPKKEGEPTRRIKGTGQTEKDFVNDGFFHEWGVNYEEFEHNAGNFSVALIEDLDGEIHQVIPARFKFINN